MSKLDAKLTVLLEEAVPSDANSPLRLAIEVAQQLDVAQRQLVELQTKLSGATDRLNGDFALQLRRRQPSLNVMLDRNGCRVGYKSKHLHFNPDLRQRVWTVRSSDPRFGQRFLRDHARSLELSDAYERLVGAVAQFFTGHYKSLNEAIVGDGQLLVEGVSSTILDVRRWACRRRVPEFGRRYDQQ